MTAPQPLTRTQHRNLVTGVDLSGSTVHRESRVDVEDYLEPIAAVRTAALHGPGVATGLRITATADKPGLQIAVGVAIDQRGRTIALQDGGFAVTARDADATTARNVPTVAVDATGVTLDTTGLAGDRVLTLAWAEAEAGGATLLRHAPWLQLLPAGDPATAVEAVTLAHVVLDAGGAVTALTAGTRATLTGRLQFQAIRAGGPPALAVEQTSTVELRARPDGGLDVVPAGAPTPALSVLGIGALTATADLTVTGTLSTGTFTTAALTVTGAATVAGALTVNGPLSASSSLFTRSLTANELTTGLLEADSLSTNDLTVTTTVSAGGALSAGGPVTIGAAPGQNRRTLHVVGSEIHSGGGGGGYSFSDRNVTEFVNSPGSGQRWVWYALGGSARLWSGGDRLLVSPGGTVTFPAGDFGRQDGPTTLSLWGSRIFDPGGGALFLRSGGGVVAFDGGDNVGIGTSAPQSLLHVAGRLFADVVATGGPKLFVIDHPLDPDRQLAHACIEGPEAAVYYRGESRLVDGVAHVVLPGYFEALVRSDGRTVQLTAVADLDEPVAVLAATPVVDGAFTVRAATEANPRQRFYWQVTGVRADVEPLEVEIERQTAAVEETMAHA